MNDPVEQIIQGLAPYIGEYMARAAVKGELLKKMGLITTKLEPAELSRLIDTLGLGLNVFVGREKGKEILAAIKKTVGV